jgi:hypothetical protein
MNVWVLWGFLRADYAARELGSTNNVIKLQAFTANCVIQTKKYDYHLHYPLTTAIDNIFPSIATYPSSEIETRRTRKGDFQSPITRVHLLYEDRSSHGSRDGFRS